jgi:hypothetical protein
MGFSILQEPYVFPILPVFRREGFKQASCWKEHEENGSNEQAAIKFPSSTRRREFYRKDCLRCFTSWACGDGEKVFQVIVVRYCVFAVRFNQEITTNLQLTAAMMFDKEFLVWMTEIECKITVLFRYHDGISLQPALLFKELLPILGFHTDSPSHEMEKSKYDNGIAELSLRRR